MKKYLSFIFGFLISGFFIFWDEIPTFCQEWLKDLKTNSCIEESVLFIESQWTNWYLNENIWQDCENQWWIAKSVGAGLQDVSCKLNWKEIWPELEEKYKKTFLWDTEEDVKKFFQKYINFCNSKNLDAIWFWPAYNSNLGCWEREQHAIYYIPSVADQSLKCYNYYLDFGNEQNWEKIVKTCENADWKKWEIWEKISSNVSNYSVSSQITHSQISSNIISSNDISILTSISSNSSNLSSSINLQSSSSSKNFDSKNIYLIIISGIMLFSLGVFLWKKWK